MKAFLPNYDTPPPSFGGPSPLPPEAGRPLTMEEAAGLVSPFTMAELLAAIDSAGTHKALGPDGIQFEVYKNCTEKYLQVIVTTINEAWASGCVPTFWKHAEIIGVPKAGKPPDRLSHLRLIALTCTLCKLAERMLASRLTWWLEGMGWYHPSQIGIGPHIGAEDGLEAFSTSVLIEGRTYRIRSILSLDVKKAYDNVSH
ncbi:hypothetical protein HPB48_026722 [Haemaphysalis longicornis]|uniref:Reverse transcriptase domain-containing protein n=1 Tax=Haemaphysalis longicornis TaxID=44386 RepID=A0A9J6H1V2_HAELO|nr:hypothetical protein HPB48_026722 [Haemaphysalis longicornis]